MAIYMARAFTKCGDLVNPVSYSTEKAAAKYRVKTETAIGCWEKVPAEKLSPVYKNDTVYIWKKYDE